MSVYLDKKDPSSFQSLNASVFSGIKKSLTPATVNTISSYLTEEKEGTRCSKGCPLKKGFKWIGQKIERIKKIFEEWLDNANARMAYPSFQKSGTIELFVSLYLKKFSKEEVLKKFNSLSYVEREGIKHEIWKKKGANPYAEQDFGRLCLQKDPFDFDVKTAVVLYCNIFQDAIAALSSFKKVLWSVSTSKEDVIQAYQKLPLLSQQLIQEGVFKRIVGESVSTQTNLKTGHEFFLEDPKHFVVKSTVCDWQSQQSSTHNI